MGAAVGKRRERRSHLGERGPEQGDSRARRELHRRAARSRSWCEPSDDDPLDLPAGDRRGDRRAGRRARLRRDVRRGERDLARSGCAASPGSGRGSSTARSSPPGGSTSTSPARAAEEVARALRRLGGDGDPDRRAGRRCVGAEDGVRRLEQDRDRADLAGSLDCEGVRRGRPARGRGCRRPTGSSGSPIARGAGRRRWRRSPTCAPSSDSTTGSRAAPRPSTAPSVEQLHRRRSRENGPQLVEADVPAAADQRDPLDPRAVPAAGAQRRAGQRRRARRGCAFPRSSAGSRSGSRPRSRARTPRAGPT